MTRIDKFSFVDMVMYFVNSDIIDACCINFDWSGTSWSSWSPLLMAVALDKKELYDAFFTVMLIVIDGVFTIC